MTGILGPSERLHNNRTGGLPLPIESMSELRVIAPDSAIVSKLNKMNRFSDFSSCTSGGFRNGLDCYAGRQMFESMGIPISEKQVKVSAKAVVSCRKKFLLRKSHSVRLAVSR